MSTTTTNLTLVKPALTELADVTVLNDNADLIDAAFSSAGIGAAGALLAHLRDVAVTTSYTGSSAKNTLDLEPTWNTSGTMRGILIQVTHTAAGASSRAIDVKRGANTIFDIDLTTAAAENGLSVVGSAPGTGATLATIGTDTNIDLLLVAKGSGVVKADGVEVVTLTGTQTLTNKTLTTPTIASLANATHTHADAAGGGQLDWDSAFTDAAHDHSSAGEGGTSLTGLTAVTLASGQLTLPVGSAASPSLVFDSGNGLYSAGTDRLNLATAGVVRAEIDAAGNVGVGATPSAWGATYRALQVGDSASVWAATSGGEFLNLSANVYYDGTDRRAINNASAVEVSLNDAGGMSVSTAPSVAAGAVQTFTQRLVIASNGTLSHTPTATGSSDTVIGMVSTPNLTRTGGTGDIYSLEINPTISVAASTTAGTVIGALLHGPAGANSGTINTCTGVYLTNPVITGNAPGATYAIFHGDSGANLSTGGAWNPASHEFKEDGSPFKLRRGLLRERLDVLGAVRAITPRVYEYADEPGREYAGPFAEELAAVSPLLGDDRSPHMVGLDALAFAAIQILDERLTALESR